MLHSYMSVTYDRYHEIRSQDLPLKASAVRGSNSPHALFAVGGGQQLNNADAEHHAGGEAKERAKDGRIRALIGHERREQRAKRLRQP